MDSIYGVAKHRYSAMTWVQKRAPQGNVFSITGPS